MSSERERERERETERERERERKRLRDLGEKTAKDREEKWKYFLRRLVADY